MNSKKRSCELNSRPHNCDHKNYFLSCKCGKVSMTIKDVNFREGLSYEFALKAAQITVGCFNSITNLYCGCGEIKE